MVETRSKRAKVDAMCAGDGTQIAERETAPPAQQSADLPPHAAVPAPSRPASAVTSRSSATIVARQLAAQAQHARHLADLERQVLERERQVANLHLQAELAAIEADASQRGSHGMRSRASVQDWVQNVVPNPDERDFLSANPHFRYGDTAQCATPGMRASHGQEAVATTHALNQVRNEDGGVTRLIDSLGKLINKVTKQTATKTDLPTFDGRSYLDWLALKRAYENSTQSFSASDNLARLSCALRGAARDAVVGLLAAACAPGVVLDALDARYGRPEFVVMHEVSVIRALPKVNYDSKDLVIFSSRVRNCVEVIRLLNQPDHLRSPELFQALWSKLPTLLRPRWLDYAHSCDGTLSKIEMFADFLSREANLQCRFGGVTECSLPTVARPNTDNRGFRDRVNVVAEIHHQNRNVSAETLSTTNIICSLCQQKHELKFCDRFVKMSVNDRWQFIKKNKICHRCLKKGWHKNKTSCIKRVCTVEGCDMRHHALLHGSKFERAVTAHVDVEDDAESKPSTSSAAEPPTCSALLPCGAPAACDQTGVPSSEDSDHEVLAHASSLSAAERSVRPLLKIVRVIVSGPSSSVDTYALLDDGSTGTFIDSKLAAQIGCKGQEKLIHLDCVGGLGMDVNIQYVNFKIKGRHSNEIHCVKRARSMSGLSAARQSAHLESVRKYPYLADIANEFCYEDVKPMLIIGIDNWHLSLAKATRKGTKTQPVAILTALGWVLYGFGCSKTKLVEVANHATVSEPDIANDRLTLEGLIREQFKIDSIGISKQEPRSADDVRAVQLLERTARRLPGGRFEVGLLWKADKLDIPDSYKLAVSRFHSLEKKMVKDPAYAERYRRNIYDMLSKGYAEPCSAPPNLGSPLWYLPHFGVINVNKPNKLRTVHDAAAKSHGVSLNSMLLTGPDLLQPLLSILMRFREGKVALIADIREMFPQIKIIEKDRDAQRFLWRDGPNEPIRAYRMSSMIFGAASSPFTAIHIKNKNALEWQDKYPDAARVIIHDHYMDDCITSLDNVHEAAKLAADIYNVHSHAGFEMRGWTSNDPMALSLLPKESLLEAPVVKDVDLGYMATNVRTLGLIWQPTRDVIGFNTGFHEGVLPQKLTKREVLAHVMRVYDPLGIIAPIVVRGRIMFQEAWRKGLEWDEKLSQGDSAAWKSWFYDLSSVSSLRIPRRYNLNDLELAGCELHVFSDASESAFAAVAYWRFLYANGDVRLSLICSKARVSPLKPVSIPRLELQGALMAARLATSVCEAHRLKPTRRIFWCDSMTTLGWLRSDARTLKPFVSHRVGEILELTDVGEWRWIPSDLNVADDATRVKRFKLTRESRWISGPAFLLSSDWPTEPVIDVSGLGREEFKHHVHLITDTDLPAPVSTDPLRFSSWLRMVRATAKAHQFISLLRMRSLQRRGIDANLTRLKGSLCTFIPSCTSSPNVPNNLNVSARITANDLRLAETHILRQSQLDSFKEDILRIKNQQPLPRNSRLFQLSPFIDDDNQLRMSSRIVAASTVTDDVKRPLVLDGKHPAVRLLILRYHQKAAHSHLDLVMNELHQRYWIIGLRNAVRFVAHTCQLCKLRRAKPFQPPMGNLPEARLAHHQRPFSFTGLDYYGPVYVTVGRRKEKRYVALFTCLVVRAVHLDVVHSLSTDSTIMCLRRFVSLRGTPVEIWSDNGTAFVGASRELRELYGDAVEDYAASEFINWRFIPPSAPFMGGAWERLIRSVKGALKITLHERAPSDEVLRTLLAEAEALVNSRPLTTISLDANAEEALTPAHFLLNGSPGRPIPATLQQSDLSSRSHWRRALRLADHFWQRWVREYLPSLSPRRSGGTTPSIAEGDVVIICDSNLPRGSWPKGRVARLFPGRDGIVRVADVATVAGTIRRPLRKLIKQPI